MFKDIYLIQCLQKSYSTFKSDVEEMLKLPAHLTIIHLNIEMSQELIIKGGEGKVRTLTNTIIS